MKVEKENAPAGATAEASINKQIQVTKENVHMNNTTVISNSAMTVPFHGAELYVISHNDEPYVPMKPIVQGMGLDWKSQYAKLTSGRFNQGVVEITIPSQGGLQKTICLSLRKLPGWLMSIHPNKVKAEHREAIILYQNECDDALWDYWNKGIAINPRPFSVGRDDVLTEAEADELRDLMKGWAAKLSSDTRVQGQFLQQGWSKLKAHFKVPYRQIPRFELPEALSIIMRHVNEWESKTSVVQAQQPYDANSLTGPDLAIAHAVQTLIERARYLVGFWHQYGPAIRMLNGNIADGVYDCFWDADWSSGLLAKKLGIPIKSREYFQNYPFDKDSLERGREYEVVSVRVL